MKSTDWKEAINKRRSIRSYEMLPVEENKRELLESLKEKPLVISWKMA
jgi:nitroreductase